jgi:hypothetical protein
MCGGSPEQIKGGKTEYFAEIDYAHLSHPQVGVGSNALASAHCKLTVEIYGT